MLVLIDNNHNGGGLMSYSNGHSYFNLVLGLYIGFTFIIHLLWFVQVYICALKCCGFYSGCYCKEVYSIC